MLILHVTCFAMGTPALLTESQIFSEKGFLSIAFQVMNDVAIHLAASISKATSLTINYRLFIVQSQEGTAGIDPILSWRLSWPTLNFVMASTSLMCSSRKDSTPGWSSLLTEIVSHHSLPQFMPVFTFP